MIQHSRSWWGIKNSGEDITNEIMRIINDADSFIIVCGYNFTFSKSVVARPFFDALIAKLSIGVQILLILPPKLHGKYNPQPKIINHCLTNNLPIILNHQNHSKWMLTDKDLYYGSSNFTDASWKDRVEVISIHEHTHLGKNWTQETIKDFKSFIDKEIDTLNTPARRMKNYRGLLTSTRAAWKVIKTLVLKFNPSIEKVILTLENYDLITSKLNEQIIYWFDQYDADEFEMIFRLSSKISQSIDNLCEYAYCYIFNESISFDMDQTDQTIIEGYNNLYQIVLETIDTCIEELPNEPDINNTQSSLSEINLTKIKSFKELLNNTKNY